MIKKIFFALIFIAFAAAGLNYFIGAPTAENNPPAQSGKAKTYSSFEYGIGFEYPERYMLLEKNLGNGERYHYQIMLVEDTQENRDVFAGKSPGREGPVAITIDIFQNNLDKYTAEQWIRGTSFSNFKLSDGNIAKISIGGMDALIYKWSGLYEADNVVVATEKNIYSLSATYIAPEDEIREVFSQILETINIGK